MNLTRWEPFREMDNLLRRYSTLMGRPAPEESSQWMPVANICESDKEYLIKTELPEVRKEDVKITLESGVITISGERKLEKEDKSQNDLRIESFYGAFARSFALPDNIDPQGVRAESKDGVLRVHIPKTAPAQPRAITVDVK